MTASIRRPPRQREGSVASPSWDEADRLAALARYDILDTPTEPAFDAITRIAALVCKAPIAAVNLVADTRQWFKSEIGLGVRETPVEISICAKAILQPGVSVVPDTTKDERFTDNPLVTGEPHLRFYAGARLDTPEGLPLGTVCILDYEPRPEGLTGEQAEILLALARQTMTHLELRRAVVAHDLLSRELSHRIQNVFTVVGGLAALTARGNPAAQDYVRQFRDRLQALALANDYVRPRADDPALDGQTVQGLLRKLLAPYADRDRARFVIEGEDAALGPTAATALAMIVHEQATNAVKYGALSVDGGLIVIRAERADDALAVTWREQGGPPLAGPPERQGFGALMTARTVSGQLGGAMAQDWRPDGLTTRLTIPLASLTK